MNNFEPRAVEFQGGFRLEVPIEQAFELFSPLGEKLWVPGWAPELLHPPGVSWARGMIFRTLDEGREVVWVVTELDRTGYHVEYQRLEPNRYVARVRVHCVPAGDATTDVRTSYAYVGLSEEGGAALAEMSASSYEEKMHQWKRRIDAYLAGRAG